MPNIYNNPPESSIGGQKEDKQFFSDRQIENYFKCGGPQKRNEIQALVSVANTKSWK